MAMRSRMKKQPVRPAMSNEYFVYDKRITNVAGMEVIDNGMDRVVRLPPAQAQYLMDQGAIGMIPAGQLSREAQAVLKQVRREPHGR